MRKTNKQSTRLADDKKGVILITILFIVAVALIFITTALTITLASRHRVYANAKSDQARLTVTSMAQSIWQAIYMQQIDDDTLVHLATSGAYVEFETDEVPGMSLGDSETTAYFYVIDDGSVPHHPFKIGIECKCSIDGETQYYTLVLKRNRGETNPPTMFNFVLNLGDGGLLETCDIGFDVTNGLPYDDDSNVIFLHHPTRNTRAQMIFDTTVLTDGYLSFQDSKFNSDAYFIGPDAGYEILSNNLSSGSAYGTFWFYGTNTPFLNSSGSTTWDLSQSVRGWNFDYAPDSDGNYNVGFVTGMDLSVQNMGNGSVSGTYANGVQSVLRGLGGNSHFDHDAPGSIIEDDTIQGYTHIDPTTGQYEEDYEDLLDTIDEVSERYADHIAPEGAESVGTSCEGGEDYTIGSRDITSKISCDVDGGDIYITVLAGSTVYLHDGGYFEITGSANNNVYFFLQDGAQIIIGQKEDGNFSTNGGIIDTRCFSGGRATSNLKQDTTPRCMIFSLYGGASGQNSPVQFNGNNNLYLTAYLGFYAPDSNGNDIGDDAGMSHFYLRNGNDSFVYYGRMTCGGIDFPPESGGTGGVLNIPYCPAPDTSRDTRLFAYRDNTDFSVVNAECGYFTA